jgi:hypothetical protein
MVSAGMNAIESAAVVKTLELSQKLAMGLAREPYNRADPLRVHLNLVSLPMIGDGHR